MEKIRRIFLSEDEMPRQWYNIVADMPNKPMPPLDPVTMKPIGPENLSAIFPMELIKQEVSQERYIDIPEKIHAGGLRYHGAGVLPSLLLNRTTQSPVHLRRPGSPTRRVLQRQFCLT